MSADARVGFFRQIILGLRAGRHLDEVVFLGPYDEWGVIEFRGRRYAIKLHHYERLQAQQQEDRE